jgi:hypothetical protein
VLHSRRKRLADLASREAAGESFWTEQFDQRARTRIVHAFRDAVGNWGGYYTYARDAILRDEGIFCLVNPRLSPDQDLINYVMVGEDEMVPTVIEAMSAACGGPVNMQSGAWDRAASFDVTVKIILREHRLSYDLIDGQMIPFSTRELHESVIAPSLKLLAGRPDLEKVESAYQDALEEIVRGNAANAITDAGTALQEALTALGCTGNSLGPLIKSAREGGLLAPHDSPMVGAVDKIMNWVSADRSERGDAHEVTSATIDDAWFTVHIVGAILLRLSKASTR